MSTRLKVVELEPATSSCLDWYPSTNPQYISHCTQPWRNPFSSRPFRDVDELGVALHYHSHSIRDAAHFHCFCGINYSPIISSDVAIPNVVWKPSRPSVQQRAPTMCVDDEAIDFSHGKSHFQREKSVHDSCDGFLFRGKNLSLPEAKCSAFRARCQSGAFGTHWRTFSR